MVQKSPKPQRGRDIESSEQSESSEQPEPFVPPETPDPVPKPEDRPAKPGAIDKDFTPPDD